MVIFLSMILMIPWLAHENPEINPVQVLVLCHTVAIKIDYMYTEKYPDPNVMTMAL